MYLKFQDVISMDEPALRSFVDLGLKEGLYLDYKQALSGSTEKEQRREFLKDITAFANSAGGNVLLGVKEPSDQLSVDEQIVGLEDGESLARDLERVASNSVDPRIPGLRFAPISLANGKWCVIVHIPPSLTRPHMVDYQGYRAFYVRHSESSVPMTTHEIRESVLTAVSTEERARRKVDRRIAEERTLIGPIQAAFLLQAVPLIAPDPPWNVLDPAFDTALRRETAQRTGFVHLGSNIAPRPTIDGLLGMDQRGSPTWKTEVHRTGYVSAFCRNDQLEQVGRESRYVVHSGWCDLFHAFCGLLTELWKVAGADLPYLISCVYFSAENTCLFTGNAMNRFSDPYDKYEIVWPEHFRGAGEDPTPIADALCLEMFNAYGKRQVVQ